MHDFPRLSIRSIIISFLLLRASTTQVSALVAQNRRCNSGHYFHQKIRSALFSESSKKLPTIMPTTREANLSKYLASVTSLWKEKNQNHECNLRSFNIIMGNQAGDADSIVSALAFSYVKDILREAEKGSSCNDVVAYTNLPVVSIRRNDLPLRRDVTLLLDVAGIDSSNLIFLDDLPPSFLESDDDDVVITLMDHNSLRSDWDYSSSLKVVEICDHHQDEEKHLESVPKEKRQVEFDADNGQALVGSTCTLVVEKLTEIHKDDTIIDAGLSFLLLGVILLDTMNMCPLASKGTKRDEEAIQFLVSQTNWKALFNNIDTRNTSVTSMVASNLLRENDTIPNVTWLYEFLRDSKFDSSFWDSLSTRDALRIDYKRFESSNDHAFGMSSVLLDSSRLLSKQHFRAQAEAYMVEEAKVDLLMVLSLVIVDGRPPKREVLVLGLSSSSVVSDMVDFLLHDESAAFLDFSMENNETSKTFSSDSGIKVVKLEQGNPKGSRKQVAPLVLSFFS